MVWLRRVAMDDNETRRGGQVARRYANPAIVIYYVELLRRGLCCLCWLFCGGLEFPFDEYEWAEKGFGLTPESTSAD